MRSFEGRARANLKCHFGGLAIVIPELEAAQKSRLASTANPKAANFDVDATRRASYQREAALAYDRYGTGITAQSGTQQVALPTSAEQDGLTKARQKIFGTLKASPEVAEVSDLYPDMRYHDSAVFGTFAPIFFVYRPPETVPISDAEKASVKRFYFVYNGRFLIAATFCDPGRGAPALEETVSLVCLLLSKSGYEFRRLSPIPTLQSLDLGGTLAVSSPMGTLFNDSTGGRRTATSLFVAVPPSVQGALRSLYETSFQHLIAFYSLKEESDTQEALFQSIAAHRRTILDLMHEFNQTRERQFLQRRRLRRLIRAHCLELTEKIGRADAISDSLTQGIGSLDSALKQGRGPMVMLNGGPSWKSYLRNDFDTKPVLEMVSRASGELGRRDMGPVIVLVALLASVAGGLVVALISRIV